MLVVTWAQDDEFIALRDQQPTQPRQATTSTPLVTRATGACLKDLFVHVCALSDYRCEVDARTKSTSISTRAKLVQVH